MREEERTFGWGLLALAVGPWGRRDLFLCGNLTARVCAMMKFKIMSLMIAIIKFPPNAPPNIKGPSKKRLNFILMCRRSKGFTLDIGENSWEY